MGSKPTIRDVAKKAGVSIATVSYVLNRNPENAISEQARKRVWDAVQALNYHRAAAAVNLARQRTRNIGIVLYLDESAVTNPFYSFVIQGILREAMARDYNVLFSYLESGYRDSRDLPKIVREANVAGVLLIGRIYPRMLRDIRETDTVVVAVDPFPSTRKVAVIQIDNRRGGELAAEHILSLGHRRAAFVGGVDDRPSIVQRREGFLRALEQAGAEAVTVSGPSLTFDAGYARSCELLKEDPHVTAIFGANDEVAAGVLHAAHELGRSVPHDLSVVGFDDIIMAKHTDPPLTTVKVDKERMGRCATTRLLALIEEDGKADVSDDLAPVELITRSSTAPPPQRIERASSARLPRR